MKKLLNKSIKIYFIFSALLLLIGVPLFYLIIEKLYIQDVDEALILRKKEIESRIHIVKNENEIGLWQDLDGDIQITPLREELKGDSIYQIYHYDSLAKETEPYRELKTSLKIKDKYHKLVIRISLVESEDMIIGIVKAQAILLILLLGGLLLINRFISKRLWKPFYQTLDIIERFNLEYNHIAPNFNQENILEFQQLNKAFEKLITENLKAYQRQKEFTENAAHELQTPLAIFQAQLETLMQHSDLTTNQAEILTKLLDSSARLNRLNKNLLLLSKIENTQFAEKEEISLSILIEKQLEFFTEQAEEKNITMKNEIHSKTTVFSNPSLVEILVSNLLLNAIRHNIQDGLVTVTLNQNSLIVSNTGNKQPIPSEKLFQRFSKTTPSTKGSGLGLAIVKKIADLDNWTIDYAFQIDSHKFTVKF